METSSCKRGLNPCECPAYKMGFATMLADGITIDFRTTISNYPADRILFSICCYLQNQKITIR
jgi:hypothetical protein